MTPARLHALVAMDEWANDEAEHQNEPRRRRPAVSKNPAADLAGLARM